MSTIIKNASAEELNDVKCLIVNKDTIKTFNIDNRLQTLKLSGGVTKGDFKNGFSINKLNDPIDNIFLKWFPIQISEGSQAYKSETVTPEMHVISHDDSANSEGEDRLACKVESFTINDRLLYNDKLYAYSENPSFKPFIDDISFSNTTIHNGIISFTVRVVYNYDEKVKMRIKLNEGEYSPYGKESLPYDLIPGTIDSKDLKIGKNTITIEISNMEETKKVEKKLTDIITVSNNAPTCKIIDKDSNSYRVHFLIEDKDLQDTISYQISISNKLCKKVLVPWTEPKVQPLNVNYVFDSSIIAVDDTNTISIEFKDNFNETKTATYSFNGKYNNIVFTDENGEYFSNDVGKILKYLDFDNIIAGATSDEVKILIKNTSAVPVTNLNVSTLYLTHTDGVKVELSKHTNPFIPMESLSYGKEVINPGEQKEFYVRMTSKISSYGFNKFQIVAKSSVVE